LSVQRQKDFDDHESVYRDTTMKITNKMHLYKLMYYSKSALHVSRDVFAHHQEHLTVFTVNGSIQSTGWCLGCVLNSSMTPAGSSLGEHHQIL